MGYLLSLQTLERSSESEARAQFASSFSMSACLSSASASVCT